MGFNCGIVGLPNVGKSTLFNALTRTAAAEAANYPFCTIEPNVGRVSVPDVRLKKLAELANSQRTVPAQLEFVDIAGLVRGASKGEGLGNQFLANIRETDAIIHVLRCYDDNNITHVEGDVDPVRDAEIVNTELMIADLESLEKRIVNWQKKAKQNDKESQEFLRLATPILNALQEGKPARSVVFAPEDKKLVDMMQLITIKPVLYVCNVQEEFAKDGNDYSAKVVEMAKNENASSVVISAKIEEELSQLNDEERDEYLATIGLEEEGLSKLIRAGYKLLGLSTYFTIGPKEARAWTIKANTKAPQAAGVIHGDFERGFICAETISYDDYISCGSEVKAKEQGKMNQQGKEYIVQDGDIILFRFNVSR